MCHLVPTFNPGSNCNQQSSLRLTNPGTRNAEITIAGRDDQGRSGHGGEVRLTLPSGASRSITSRELENGGGGLRGRLGDGVGKWQLFVSADQPIRVLSLLTSPTRHVTSLSTTPYPMSTPTGCGETGAGGSPDLIVESPTVSDATLTPLQVFTLSATVRNKGDGDYVGATTVGFYYRTSAPASVISNFDILISTSTIVGGLAASQSTTATVLPQAPREPGTYYFGACVGDDAGEEKLFDRFNNCSEATQIRVQSLPSPPVNRYGAIAVGLLDRNSCAAGFAWGIGKASSQGRAQSLALEYCRNLNGVDCGLAVEFRNQCGAVAVGNSGSGCGTGGGGGSTRHAAEQDALSDCRAIGYSNCRILSGGGSRASACTSDS